MIERQKAHEPKQLRRTRSRAGSFREREKEKGKKRNLEKQIRDRKLINNQK